MTTSPARPSRRERRARRQAARAEAAWRALEDSRTRRAGVDRQRARGCFAAELLPFEAAWEHRQLSNLPR